MGECFDLENGKKRIDETGRKLFKRTNIRITAFQVWAAALAPLVEGLLITNLFPFKSSQWYLYLIFLVIASTHVYASIHVGQAATAEFHYFDFQDLYKQYNVLSNEHYKLKSSLKTFKYISNSIHLSLVALEKIYAQDKKISSEETKRGFKAILWPLIQFREHIFDFKSGAFYNFAVFLYDENDKKLKVFYREHSKRLKPKKRSWKVGRGHVGLCFAQKDIKISPDIMKSHELATDIQPQDDLYYRSMVSIPINKIGDSRSTDIDPYGVIVITSSHTNQFDTNLHSTLFLTLAKVLAIFCDRVYDKLEGELIYEYDE